MKTFVVTGVAGLIGSHLARHLAANGHCVIGVDNLSGGYDDNIPDDALYRFYPSDVVNSGVKGLIPIVRQADVVIHCAALAYEGLSCFSPGQITENIVVGTTNLATAIAATSNVSRLVNTSSMARYGHGDGSGMFWEDMQANPVDPYGMAKLFAEQQSAMIGRMHGFEVVHAVPHSVNGPGQKYDDPYRNVASIIINQLLRGRQPYVYGDGTQRRGFCDVRDVLDVYQELALSPRVSHGEVYNIGPDDPIDYVSINELGRMIGEIVGKRFDPILLPGRPNEVHHANCSAEKIKGKFGFRQKYQLWQTLRDMVHYIEKRGPRDFSYDHVKLEIEKSKKLMCPATWKSKLY